jgi:hypothetical protein
VLNPPDRGCSLDEGEWWFGCTRGVARPVEETLVALEWVLSSGLSGSAFRKTQTTTASERVHKRRVPLMAARITTTRELDVSRLIVCGMGKRPAVPSGASSSYNERGAAD